MHKTILFIVTALLGATAGASAASIGSDEWTNAGNAWSLSNQSLFSTNHIIIANDRSGFAEGQYGELKSSEGPSWLMRHLTGHSFYAGLSTVDFELSPKAFVTGTQVVRLEVLLNFGFSERPTLTVTGVNGGTYAALLDSQTVTNTELGDVTSRAANGLLESDPLPDVVDQPLELYIFSWTLDHPLGSEDTFYLNFGINRYSSISSVILTQEAVPEPATYALLAGAFGLAAVVVARRRRRI